MSFNNSNDFESVNDNNLKIKNIFIDIFDIVVKSLIIILIMTTFVFKVCTVVGGSMENTLHDKEQLVISNFLYQPKENDVIVFHQTGSLNEPVVKRVIATSGKWVKIDYDNCILYVSEDNVFDEGDIVDESSYIHLTDDRYNIKGSYSVYVPDGYLFVMGDNRNHSTDSRFESIGLVDERTVLGKVILRFAPLDKIGFIK